MEPNTEEWRALYEAAVGFREVAPWQWMWDSAVFGVQDPESRKIGYCCIMGRLGEHFALAVYNGSEGLAGLWEMREMGPRAQHDPLAVMLLQDCLMASFEDRRMLDRPDLEQIKALGYKFRGRGAWPQFRCYRPGYFPWYLTAPEARFLTICLQQSLDIGLRYRANPEVLPEPEPDPRGRYLVRVPEKQDGVWVWKDSVQRPVPVRRAELPPPGLDEERLQRLRALPGRGGALQMDYFFTDGTIKDKEDERPWYPQVVLTADARSGYILGTKLARPDEVPAVLVTQCLDVIARMGNRPDRIEVGREEARVALQPAAQRLRIRVIRVRRLAALETARREFSQFLRR